MLSKFIQKLMKSDAGETTDFIACQALVTMVMMTEEADIFEHVPVESVIKCVW